MRKPNVAKRFLGIVSAACFGLSTVAALAGTATYTYDSLGRVRQVNFTDGSTVTYKYDGAGNRVQVDKSPILAPTVGNVSMSTAYNTAGTATLTPSGNWTSLSVVSQSANGNATISGTTATFTPNSGYIGTTSFTYRATGPGGNSGNGTVTVTVNAPAAPTVGNVSMSTPKNTAGIVTLTPSGNWTSLSVVSQSANGNATISGTTATFTPTTNYTGSTSFTYRATGPGGNSGNGTVSVTVTAPSNAPPTCSNGSYAIIMPAPPYGPPTMTWTSNAANFLNLCSDSDGGTLSLTTPTTFSWTISRGQTVNIPFTVSDGQGGSASATFTLTFP